MNVSNATNCPSAFINAHISNFNDGDFFSNPNADHVDMQQIFIDVNGIIVKRCMYEYREEVGGPPISGSFVSDCVNKTDNLDYNSDTVALINNACT